MSLSATELVRLQMDELGFCKSECPARSLNISGRAVVAKAVAEFRGGDSTEIPSVHDIVHSQPVNHTEASAMHRCLSNCLAPAVEIQPT